jgi:hypothetical protein
MQYLRADSITEVTIGPAVAVGDGFTPVITLSIAGADEAEIIKHGATATVGIAGTLAAISGADGYYALDLSATDTDTEGRLTLLINDDSLILPIRMEFMVVAANIFDSLFAVAGTDLLQIDLTQIVGDTVPAPTTTGILDVNTERWADTLVTLSGALPDVNVEAMDANSIAVGVMAANSIGVTAMAAGSIAAGTIAAGELTNIEDEIWDALKSAHVVANSFGDFLDIEVSSRLASADINLTGGAVDVVTAITNAVTVGTINANVINAASIAATAMNDKGNWNIGKTGYALTQTFPANFADLSIVITTGLVDITQTAADKAWATAARILTASTNFNDIAATDIVSAGAITTLAGAVVNVDTVDSVTGAVGSVSGAVGSVTGNVDGNVTGSVGSVATGGIVAGSFGAGAINAAAIATDAIDADALATSAVDKIREAILPKQNEAFTFTFLFVAASDHVTPVTGATGITDFRSIDGAAFAAGGATVTEVGNGIYEYAATTGDMNGGVITFRFAATGGTPGAPDDAFVEIVTSGGV